MPWEACRYIHAASLSVLLSCPTLHQDQYPSARCWGAASHPRGLLSYYCRYTLVWQNGSARRLCLQIALHRIETKYRRWECVIFHVRSPDVPRPLSELPACTLPGEGHLRLASAASKAKGRKRCARGHGFVRRLRHRSSRSATRMSSVLVAVKLHSQVRVCLWRAHRLCSCL